MTLKSQKKLTKNLAINKDFVDKETYTPYDKFFFTVLLGYVQ